MTPIALVIDRPTAARIAVDVKKFGGAWADMFDAWQRMNTFPYLVMLAHTKERIRQRAPLTAMAADDDALRLALKQFCAELSDVKCRWALFVEAGSAAESIAREELLLDTKTEGHA
jgi:hypothetical protein